MSLDLREPWIGKRFEGPLVLGESHYGDDDPGLTLQVIEEAVDCRSPHAFLAKIEKVVSGFLARLRGEASFWHRVAFANYCPGTVAAARRRPTEETWEEGYRLLPKLLTAVKPRRILVLGNATWNNRRALKDVSYFMTAGNKREIGRLDPDAIIRHPSSWGFSTMRWHAYYQAFVSASPP